MVYVNDTDTHLHLPPLTPIDMLQLMLLGVFRYTFFMFYVNIYLHLFVI